MSYNYAQEQPVSFSYYYQLKMFDLRASSHAFNLFALNNIDTSVYCSCSLQCEVQDTFKFQAIGGVQTQSYIPEKSQVYIQHTSSYMYLKGTTENGQVKIDLTKNKDDDCIFILTSLQPKENYVASPFHIKHKHSKKMLWYQQETLQRQKLKNILQKIIQKMKNYHCQCLVLSEEMVKGNIIGLYFQRKKKFGSDYQCSMLEKFWHYLKKIKKTITKFQVSSIIERQFAQELTQLIQNAILEKQLNGLICCLASQKSVRNLDKLNKIYGQTKQSLQKHAQSQNYQQVKAILDQQAAGFSLFMVFYSIINEVKDAEILNNFIGLLHLIEEKQLINRIVNQRTCQNKFLKNQCFELQSDVYTHSENTKKIFRNLTRLSSQKPIPKFEQFRKYMLQKQKPVKRQSKYVSSIKKTQPYPQSGKQKQHQRQIEMHNDPFNINQVQFYTPELLMQQYITSFKEKQKNQLMMAKFEYLESAINRWNLTGTQFLDFIQQVRISAKKRSKLLAQSRFQIKLSFIPIEQQQFKYIAVEICEELQQKLQKYSFINMYISLTNTERSEIRQTFQNIYRITKSEVNPKKCYLQNILTYKFKNPYKDDTIEPVPLAIKKARFNRIRLQSQIGNKYEQLQYCSSLIHFLSLNSCFQTSPEKWIPSLIKHIRQIKYHAQQWLYWLFFCCIVELVFQLLKSDLYGQLSEQIIQLLVLIYNINPNTCSQKYTQNFEYMLMEEEIQLAYLNLMSRFSNLLKNNFYLKAAIVKEIRKLYKVHSKQQSQRLVKILRVLLLDSPYRPQLLRIVIPQIKDVLGNHFNELLKLDINQIQNCELTEEQYLKIWLEFQSNTFHQSETNKISIDKLINLLRISNVEFKAFLLEQISFSLSGYSQPLISLYDSEYVNISEKGEMNVVINQSWPKQLEQFLIKEIQSTETYTPNNLFSLLLTIQASIKHGVFSKIQNLNSLSDCLNRINIINIRKQQNNKSEKQQVEVYNQEAYTNTSKQILQNIQLSLKIQKLILEVQVNVWVTATYEMNETQSQIFLADKIKEWKFDTSLLIDLCLIEQKRIKDKVLELFCSIYEIQKLVQEFRQLFKKRKLSNSNIQKKLFTKQKFEKYETIQDLRIIISNCVKSCDLNYCDPQFVILHVKQTLESLFIGYQTNQFYQCIYQQTGVYEKLLKQLSETYQVIIQEADQAMLLQLYWKIVAVFTICNQNCKNKSILRNFNYDCLFNILQQVSVLEGPYKYKQQVSYVLICLLEEIFLNNQALIVMENRWDIECIFKIAMLQLSQPTQKFIIVTCKLFTLIWCFMEAGSRRINKICEFVSELLNFYIFQIVSSLTKIQWQNNEHERQLLFMILLTIFSMDKNIKFQQLKHKLSYAFMGSSLFSNNNLFQFSLNRINAILRKVQFRNLPLKVRAYKLVTFKNTKKDEIVYFLQIFKRDCRKMLQLYCQKQQNVIQNTSLWLANLNSVIPLILQGFKIVNVEDGFKFKIIQRILLLSRYFILSKPDKQQITTIIQSLGSFLKLRLKIQSDVQLKQITQKIPKLLYEVCLDEEVLTSLKDGKNIVEKLFDKKSKSYYGINNAYLLIPKIIGQKVKKVKLEQDQARIISKTIFEEICRVDSSEKSQNKKVLRNSLMPFFYSVSNNIENQIISQIPLLIDEYLTGNMNENYQTVNILYRVLINSMQKVSKQNVDSKICYMLRGSQTSRLLNDIFVRINQASDAVHIYYDSAQGSIQAFNQSLSKKQAHIHHIKRSSICHFIKQSFHALSALSIIPSIKQNIIKNSPNKLPSTSLMKLGLQMNVSIGFMIMQNIKLAEETNSLIQQIQSMILPIYCQISKFILAMCKNLGQFAQNQNKIQVQSKELFIKSGLLQLFDAIGLQSKKIQKSENMEICVQLRARILPIILDLWETSDSFIQANIREKICSSALITYISDVFNLPKEIKSKRHAQNMQKQEGFEYLYSLQLLCPIIKYLEIQDQLKLTLSSQHFSRIKIFLKNTKNIEIVTQNLNKTIFYIMPNQIQAIPFKIKENIVNSMLQTEKRQSRLLVLFQKRELIYQQIAYQRQRKQKDFINDHNLYTIFVTLVLLSFFIVLFLAFSINVSINGLALHQRDHNFIRVICLVHLIFSISLLLGWTYQSKRAIIVMMKQQQNEQKLLKNGEWKFYLSFFKHLAKHQSIVRSPLTLFLISLYSLLFDYKFHALTLFLLLFKEIQVLDSILVTLIAIWKKLASLFIFTGTTAFIFGFMMLNRYLEGLVSQEQNSLQCHNILSCIDYLFTQGVVGQDNFDLESANHITVYASNTVYWIIFSTLLGGLISGIITDRFGQDRAGRQKRQQQLKSKCLVCSATSQQLQKRQENFEVHVEKHKLWYYLGFLMKIEGKTDKHSRMTTTEKYVYDKLFINKQNQQKLFSWLPQAQKSEYLPQRKFQILKPLPVYQPTRQVMFKKARIHSQIPQKKKRAIQVQPKQHQNEQVMYRQARIESQIPQRKQRTRHAKKLQREQHQGNNFQLEQQAENYESYQEEWQGLDSKARYVNRQSIPIEQIVRQQSPKELITFNSLDIVQSLQRRQKPRHMANKVQSQKNKIMKKQLYQMM